MFYLTTHSTHFIYGYMEGRKEMFYLTTHSTHFIYGYMASDEGPETFTTNKFTAKRFDRKVMKDIF